MYWRNFKTVKESYLVLKYFEHSREDKTQRQKLSQVQAQDITKVIGWDRQEDSEQERMESDQTLLLGRIILATTELCNSFNKK